MMCRSDAVGDVVRAHLDATMWLEWEFEAISYLDAKLKCYHCLGLGEYVSDNPELESQPY